jgi:hypothetical protein
MTDEQSKKLNEKETPINRTVEQDVVPADTDELVDADLEKVAGGGKGAEY